MSLEFRKYDIDHCLYFYSYSDNDFIVLFLYVDDILGANTNINGIANFIARMTREFRMKDLKGLQIKSFGCRNWKIEWT